MKAIAFAIICAAYLLVPTEEIKKTSEGFQIINGAVFLVCIFGFWINILFEGNK